LIETNIFKLCFDYSGYKCRNGGYDPNGSIGGAGAFDGIFLTGTEAVLLT